MFEALFPLLWNKNHRDIFFTDKKIVDKFQQILGNLENPTKLSKLLHGASQLLLPSKLKTYNKVSLEQCRANTEN